jgi:aldose sugar dehydrogenase
MKFLLKTSQKPSQASRSSFSSILLLTILCSTLICENVNSSQGSKSQQKTKDYTISFHELTKGHDVVWGFDFINENQIIFTQRNGKLNILDLTTKTVSEVKNPPYVVNKGQGGLLDVRVHPEFSKNSLILLTYSKSVGSKITTALYQAKLSGNSLVEGKDLFVAKAESTNSIHYGSRITFDQKNNIFLSVGDRNDREESQNLKVHNGKILRLTPNGEAHPDNKLEKNPGGLKEIYSYGHRNPQGLFFDLEKNLLWSSEFGPRGGDELNLINMGENYGWPIVTFGREYWGPRIGEGTTKAGMVDAKVVWNPSISPSAMIVYQGSLFEKWKSHVFLACLGGQEIRRVNLSNDSTKNSVVDQETIGEKLSERFRSIRTGPKGQIFVSTDSGKIIQINKE